MQMRTRFLIATARRRISAAWRRCTRALRCGMAAARSALHPTSGTAAAPLSLGELRAEALAASLRGDPVARDRAMKAFDDLLHAAQGGSAGAA